MKSKIMVSVIIPTFNNAQYIQTAINSVLIQNVSYEIIVVDDCSNDGTDNVIKEYCNLKNFHYIRNKKNLGVAESRNIGVRKAVGYYIAFLDADDYWLYNKLEKQLALLLRVHGFFCYTSRILMKEDGTLTNQVLTAKEKVSYYDILHNNDIACSSVILLRKIALKYPMQNSDSHEDYLNWLRILKSGYSAYGIKEPLLCYRIHSKSKSRNKLKSLFMIYKTYKYLGLNTFISSVYVCIYTINRTKKYFTSYWHSL